MDNKSNLLFNGCWILVDYSEFAAFVALLLK